MKYNVFGIGHAISDLEFKITENFLNNLNLIKGRMALIDTHKHDKLLKLLKQASQAHSAPGGSAVNTLTALAKLGQKCCFLGGLGDDAMGREYLAELTKLEIPFLSPLQTNGTSGSCLVCITPDAERTMFTTIGCSGNFVMTEAATAALQAAQFIFLEGYLFDGIPTAIVVDKVMAAAKTHNIPIALSASDTSTLHRSFGTFLKLLPRLRIFFGNENELTALAGVPQPEKEEDVAAAMLAAGKVLNRKGLLLVGTAGVHGSYLWDSRTQLVKTPLHIPAQPVKVLNTSGAGDVYAAGILNGVIRQQTPEEMGKHATELASIVVGRAGPRY